jgi:hypothetical protein
MIEVNISKHRYGYLIRNNFKIGIKKLKIGKKCVFYFNRAGIAWIRIRNRIRIEINCWIGIRTRIENDADPQRWLSVLIKSYRIPTGNILELGSSRCWRGWAEWRPTRRRRPCARWQGWQQKTHPEKPTQKNPKNPLKKPTKNTSFGFF